MNQRKDTYRAALRREPQSTTTRGPSKVTELHTRYVRLTIEVSPALSHDFTRWVTAPVSALGSAGAAVLRPLTRWDVMADAAAVASMLMSDVVRGARATPAR